jgi:hypothetical protein
VLDKAPESLLEDILNFLKNLQNQPQGQLKLTETFRQILEEDIELLEKLAK